MHDTPVIIFELLILVAVTLYGSTCSNYVIEFYNMAANTNLQYVRICHGHFVI